MPVPVLAVEIIPARAGNTLDYGLQKESPESSFIGRLLLLDDWQSGLLHHLAKVTACCGSGVRISHHPLVWLTLIAMCVPVGVVQSHLFSVVYVMGLDCLLHEVVDFLRVEGFHEF